MEQAGLLISSLGESSEPGRRLAAAALAYSDEDITFDAAYYKIAYPNGDIASNKGAAADVVIRCCRKLGIDLQQEVHEDMSRPFPPLPAAVGRARRRTATSTTAALPTSSASSSARASVLTPSREPADYQPGDIVVWSLANAEKHIGIVVPGPGKRANEAWVVHHKDTVVKWEDVLFDYKIDGHFRFPAARVETDAADSVRVVR